MSSDNPSNVIRLPVGRARARRAKQKQTEAGEAIVKEMTKCVTELLERVKAGQVGSLLFIEREVDSDFLRIESGYSLGKFTVLGLLAAATNAVNNSE